MKPKQFYYGLLALLGALIIGGLVGFWLSHQALNNKITALQKLSSDLVLENDEISRLEKLEAQYQQLEPLANKVSSILPTQKEQDEVVAQIATIVTNNGLELSGLTFDKTTGLPDEKSQTQPGSVGGILTMPVRFQTVGSYNQLRSMLLDFEKQQRFMRVNTLEISRNDNGSITASLVLEVFLKP